MTDPLALLIGMLLDQQVPMEWAFKGPATLKERLGGTLDAAAIAAMSEDDVVAVFVAKPALHRFPAAMGKRAHELCQFLVDNYDGDAGAVWRDVTDGDELYRRVRELPGYGDEKAKIFIAILAKRLGKRPTGWELVGRAVLRRHAPLGRRRRLGRVAGQGARVQEDDEGAGQEEVRLVRRTSGTARSCGCAGGRASRAGRRPPVGRGAAGGRPRR